MPKQIEFEGKIHEFPDDFTDADISKALAVAQPAAEAVTPEVAAPAVEQPIVPEAETLPSHAPQFAAGAGILASAPHMKQIARGVGKTLVGASVAPKIALGSIEAGLGAGALHGGGAIGMGAGINAGGSIGAKIGKQIGKPIRNMGEAVKAAASPLPADAMKRLTAASPAASNVSTQSAFAKMMAGKGAVISPAATAPAITAAKATKPGTLATIGKMFPKFSLPQKLTYAATRAGTKMAAKAAPFVGTLMMGDAIRKQMEDIMKKRMAADALIDKYRTESEMDR